MRSNYTVLSSYCTPGYIPKNNYGNLNSYLEEGFQIVVNPSMDETTISPSLTTTRRPILSRRPITTTTLTTPDLTTPDLTTTSLTTPALTVRPITTTPALTMKPIETDSRITIPPLFSPIGVL